MGIACPSARRPDQNRHRLADGWQGSTVRAILESPLGSPSLNVEAAQPRNGDYLSRGLMRCGVCGRKTQGGAIRKHTFYRCIARTLAPGSAALAEHSKTVNLREDVLLEPLNAWIGRLFNREQVDATVAALIASQGAKPASLSRLNEQIRLALRFEPRGRAVIVTASPRVANVCVRGGT